MLGLSFPPVPHFSKFSYVVFIDFTKIVYFEELSYYSIKALTPRKNRNMATENWNRYFRPKHSCTSEFNPFLMHRMKDVNFKRRFSIRKVCRPNSYFFISHFFIKVNKIS